ncbi:MAG: hypothetical protein ACREOO_06325 [bacterium]
MQTQSLNSSFLRRALQVDGVFSFLSGIILIIGADRLAKLLGLQNSVILLVVGVALLIYATGLFLNVRRAIINRTEAIAAAILNFGWVAGSAVVIAWGVLTTTGNWLVAIAAEVVLLFGILQIYGLRKMAPGK